MLTQEEIQMFRRERFSARAQIAQLVEQRTENPRVAGSISRCSSLTANKQL